MLRERAHALSACTDSRLLADGGGAYAFRPNTKFLGEGSMCIRASAAAISAFMTSTCALATSLLVAP